MEMSAMAFYLFWLGIKKAALRRVCLILKKYTTDS